MEFETQTRTNDMMIAAKAFEGGEATGQLIELPPQSVIAPTSSAVFAEPVIVAQPMQKNQKRNIPDFLSRMKVLAAMAGEEYRYSFPVKQKNGQKKSVEGGTIKMANDLVREYGNCMVDVRVIEQGDSHVFYARFIDYETGFCMTRPFRQRKGQKTMGDDPERAQDIVFQIGASKAIRNVILNALGTFADFTYEEAKNALVDKVGKDLIGWRNKISAGCAKHGYDLKRIEHVVAKPLGEWVAVDIARVVAELKSISDGMTTFNDLYPIDGGDAVGELNKEFLSDAGGVSPTTMPPSGQVFTQSSTAETKPAEVVVEDTAQPLPPALALNNLMDAIEKAAPENRVSMFLDGNGQQLFEETGSNKKTAEVLKKLGVNVITN